LNVPPLAAKPLRIKTVDGDFVGSRCGNARPEAQPFARQGDE
jgi:hypothetical protein